MSDPSKEPPIMMNPYYPPPQEARTVMYQPPQVVPIVTHASCGLIYIGILIILLSIGSLGMSGYMWLKLGDVVDIILASMICGAFFFCTGFFSTCGGCSVWSRQGCIVTSACLGLLGVIVALVADYYFLEALNTEEKHRTLCTTCHLHLLGKNLDIRDPTKILNFGKEEMRGTCDFMCSAAPYAILGSLALGEGILGLLLSCVACCNTCRCCVCYKAPPRNVVAM